MNNEEIKEQDESRLRRLVRVAVDPYFIREVLTQGKEIRMKCVEGLPIDAEWIGEFFDNQSFRVYFIFRHESFEPVAPGLVLPIYYPSYQLLNTGVSCEKAEQAKEFIDTELTKETK